MGRSKYKITKSDFKYAYEYIERNISNIAITTKFHLIVRNNDPDALTKLLELNLDSDEWRMLKSTIRVERKKDKTSDKEHTIKIKKNSFSELTALKNKMESYLSYGKEKQVKLCYSEIIEKVCEHFNDEVEIDAANKLGYYNKENIKHTKKTTHLKPIK